MTNILLFKLGGFTCYFACYVKKLSNYKYDDACDVLAGYNYNKFFVIIFKISNRNYFSSWNWWNSKLNSKLFI
jgi:hypothetical protein